MFKLFRAGDWWQYKIAPVVALVAATTLVEHKALLPLWREIALLVVALAVCAAYVSVVNDLADGADDRAAQKLNRQLAYSKGVVLAVIAFTIAAGAAIAWRWRDQPFLLASYLGSWLVFSLYSLPPFRFKGRGFAGVLCDAAGAHLFPALTAILVASGRGAWDRAWMAAAAVWAFSYGVRGILWHQLADRDSDALAGMQTFAVRRPVVAARLGAWIAFPAEIAALSVLLWRIAQPLPLIALVCYALLLAARVRHGLTLVVVTPKPGCISVMQEYYDVFFPIALLLCAAARDWHALILVAAFIAFFPHGFMRVARDFRQVSLEFAVMLRDAFRVPRPRTPS